MKEAHMRPIHDHKVNPANDKIELVALDGPGSGGASHEYRATLPDGQATLIKFQNGPINEAGVNGLTHEVLLAIVVDRMRDFQRGAYACRENAIALTKLEEAQHWLHARTRGRVARGVEGTHAA
jgi:hypothetical protein